MAAGGEPSPGAAPALTPQASRGDDAQAEAQVQVALRILETALVKMGSTTARGKAIMKGITALVKEFGRDEDRAQQILPAELKSAMLDNSAPPGSPPPPPGGGGGALPTGAPPG